MTQLGVIVEGYPPTLDKARGWYNGRCLHKPITDEARKFLKEKGALEVMKLERKRQEGKLTEEEAGILNQFEGWALTVDKIEHWVLDFPRECEEEVLWYFAEKEAENARVGFKWGGLKRWTQRLLKWFGWLLHVKPAPDTKEKIDGVRSLKWDEERKAFVHPRSNSTWRLPDECEADLKYHFKINAMPVWKVLDDDHPRSGQEMI